MLTTFLEVMEIELLGNIVLLGGIFSLWILPTLTIDLAALSALS